MPVLSAAFDKIVSRPIDKLDRNAYFQKEKDVIPLSGIRDLIQNIFEMKREWL